METVASLIASDYFLVPVQMKDFSITSIGQTFKTAMTVKKAYNNELEPVGIFVSSTDNRIKQAKVALEELKEFCKETEIPLLKTTIPSVSKFDFLPRNQQTIFDVVAAKERGHKDYLDLTKEILTKMKSIEASNINKNLNQSAGV
jgi:cellulose biosynthesis protein BcsQ